MTLVVIGDRAGPAALGNPFIALFEPREQTQRLVEPTKSDFEEALVACDRFWFWGHGNHGGLWLRKGVYFGLEEVSRIAKARPKKLYRATLRACHTASTAEAVNTWLDLALVVEGFADVTMEPWGLVRPMLHFESRIDYNPRAVQRVSGW